MLASHPAGSRFSVPAQGTIHVGEDPFGLAFDNETGQVFVVNEGSGNVSVISDTTDTVVATIPVGFAPVAAAFDALLGEVFVTNLGSGNVSVISDQTDTVVATIALANGSGPFAVAWDQGTDEMFVADFGTNNVSVIAASDEDTVVATIPVGTEPFGLAYDSGNGEVFVSNWGTDNVSVISDVTDAVVATIPVGYDPWGVAYDPSNGEVFVANSASDNVSIIDGQTNSVVGSVEVGYAPLGLAYEPTFGNIYVADVGEDDLAVIQASSGDEIGLVPLGSYLYPLSVAYDASTAQFFVTDEGTDNVSVVNDTAPAVEVQLWKGSWFGSETCSNGLVPPAPTSGPQTTESWVSVSTPYTEDWWPFGSNVAFTAAFSATLFAPTTGVYGFGLGSDDGSAAFLDSGLLVSTPQGYCGGAGEGDNSLVLSAGAHQLRVFFYASAEYGLSYIDLYWRPPGASNYTLIPPSAFGYTSGMPIPVGTSPGTPIYADGQIFVPDSGSATLTVVSGATREVVASLPVGDEPGTPVYDSATQQVFVPNFGSGNVSVVSASSDTVVATVAVGTDPETGVYDPATGDVYVPNAGSNNVTDLAGATDTAVANVAVGVDPQAPALDGLNGDVYVANNGSNTVSVLNASTGTVVATVPVGNEPGTPAVDLANDEIYVPNYGSDNVSVISGSTNTVVATIAVGGSPFGPRESSPLPFGFSRTTKPRGGPLYDALNHDVYVANAASGNLSVINGTKNAVTATVAVGTGPQAPVLDPANGNVYVANDGSANVSVISGNTSEVVASIPTGADPVPPVFDNTSGTLFVPNSGSANLTVVAGSYYLTFTETGLPSGSNWRVVVTGAKGTTAGFFSRTTSPAVPLTNGTVRYTVFGPSGYQVSGTVPATAIVKLSGADIVERVHFAKAPTRTVTFDESGLPKGVGWCAEFAYVACTSSSKLTFANVTPDQYPYALFPIAGFTITVAKGGTAYAAPPEAVVNVTTHAVTVKVKFAPATYALVFTESGLAKGTKWSVKVSWTFYGKVEKASAHSTGASITLEVPNGTVSYTIEPVKGYTGSYSGSTTIDGAPGSIYVTYTKT